MAIFYPPPPPSQGASNSTLPLPHEPIGTQGDQPPLRQTAAVLMMAAAVAAWPATTLEPRPPQVLLQAAKIAPLTLPVGDQPAVRGPLHLRTLTQLVRGWTLEPLPTQASNQAAAWIPPPIIVTQVPYVAPRLEYQAWSPAAGRVDVRTTIAPLTLPTGDTPPPHASDAQTLARLVSAWATSNDAQTAPKNGWNVPPATNTHKILIAAGVGSAGGYSDVSPKQVVRTSGNRVYAVGTNCDTYPCTALTQTVRVWRADQTGLPTSFTRKDTLNEPANAGSVACAIDGNDVIHLVWQDRSVPKVRYATFDTATDTWGIKEDVDAAIGAVPDAGQGDSICAIALDAAGKPHVAYLYENTIRRLAYRNRVSGVWSALVAGIDDNTYVGNRKAWVPNIAFDTAGRRVFAWMVGAFNLDTDGQICVRVMDTDDTLGTRADVGASTAKVGIDQSTTLLCNGTIHTAWILGGVAGTEYVRYAYAIEGKSPTFTLNNPANADTHDPSIGIGDAGKIRIYGHGTESPNDDNLYYWEGAGSGGSWTGRTLYASGQFDASVSTRWSQYFFNQPTYADIVYWDQNYPNDYYYGGEIVNPAPPKQLPRPALALSTLIQAVAAWNSSWSAQTSARIVTTTLPTGDQPAPILNRQPVTLAAWTETFNRSTNLVQVATLVPTASFVPGQPLPPSILLAWKTPQLVVQGRSVIAAVIPIPPSPFTPSAPFVREVQKILLSWAQEPSLLQQYVKIAPWGSSQSIVVMPFHVVSLVSEAFLKPDVQTDSLASSDIVQETLTTADVIKETLVDS